MTNEKFRSLIDSIRTNSLEILIQRNALYAKGADDALHNFKAGAEIMGETPAQTAWGYMTKHLVALRDMIQHNDFSDKEQLQEKCTDIINYVAIIYAIGCEEKEAKDALKTCAGTCIKNDTKEEVYTYDYE